MVLMITRSDKASEGCLGEVLPSDFQGSRAEGPSMRSALLVGFVLPALLALVLTGCSSVSAAKPGETTNTSGGSAAPAVPASKVGTRENPAAAGTKISVKDIVGNPEYEVVVGVVTLDATAAVAAANMFNAAPKPGFQFIMFPVTYTYVGKTTGTPGFEVSVDFVSAAGTTHTSSDALVVLDGGVTSLNEMYPGASATGNVAIEVPTQDVAKGLLTVGPSIGTSKFFVKTA